MNFLKRLFGKKDEPVELPPEFLGDNPPDWLIDLKGPGLAQGRAVSVRVQIHAANRTGSAEIVVLPEAEGGEPTSATVSLDKTEIDRLLVILGFSFPADFMDTGDSGEDGARVSIHRHEPYMVRNAVCNLAEWLDSRKPGPPVVEVGRILVEIQRRA